MRTTLILTLLLGSLTLSACQKGMPSIPGLNLGKVSDEDQVAAVMDDVYHAMETKRVSKILSHVSPSYRDKEGRDYNAIREYLTQILKGYRVIRITRTPPKIVVEGNRARALETFGTTAEPFDPIAQAPVNLQGQVEVSLERVDNTWLIVEWGSLL